MDKTKKEIVDGMIMAEIELAVNKFLTKNGGLQNGYITWVTGEVRTDILSGSLQWLTPMAEKLTGIKKREQGCQLYDSIQKIMLAYKVECIRFENRHIEDGCYATTINIVQTHRIFLRRE